MKLTRDTIKALRPLIEEELLVLGKLHGVKFEVANASFMADGSSASFKLEVSSVAEDGTVETRERSLWRQLAPFHGFKAEHLGQGITVKGTDYVITGWNNKADRYPVEVRRMDGVRFKLTKESVQRALGIPFTPPQ